tara:strand:+ start:2302 stop:2760 length:459 start_codon:yes stop_codon:yes gene_type:complete
MKNIQATYREFATYEEQSEYLREIDAEELKEAAAAAQKEKRRMREVEWSKWSSNSSGTQSEVHVTADGLATLCNKKIPQIHGSNLNGVKPRSDRWVSGSTSSATGGTTYDTFVRYSSTVRGGVSASHEYYGTCQCCVNRSEGKFINNQRTNS